MLAILSRRGCDTNPIDLAEAADWIERQMTLAPVRGSARVLFHSVVWSYLSEHSQNRIRAHLNRAGAVASSETPLAWLRFELTDSPELRLTMWPSGEESLLARAHPQGAWVRWLACVTEIWLPGHHGCRLAKTGTCCIVWPDSRAVQPPAPGSAASAWRGSPRS
jgi:hypothetical protein